jgi:hypothetical protein
VEKQRWHIRKVKVHPRMAANPTANGWGSKVYGGGSVKTAASLYARGVLVMPPARMSHSRKTTRSSRLVEGVVKFEQGGKRISVVPAAH